MLELLMQWFFVACIIGFLLYVFYYKASGVEPYQYRVVEYAPYTFEIQVLKKSTTGYLWWKKRKEEWVAVDIAGRPYGINKRYDDFYYVEPKMSHLQTRAAAERRIAEFTGNEVINNVISYYSNSRVKN